MEEIKEESKENFAYVRIPADVMEEVARLAKSDKRSKTNMVSVLLREALAFRKHRTQKNV